MEICKFHSIVLAVSQYYFPIFFNGQCYFKKAIFRHITEHVNIFMITHYFTLILFYLEFLFLKQGLSENNHNISLFRDEEEDFYTVLFLNLG